MDKVAGPCQKLPQELREQLQVLGIDTCPSPDHRTDHVPLEQREQLLVKVLPLYIQVLCVCETFVLNSSGASVSVDVQTII